MIIRCTSVDKKIDNSGKSTTDAEEEHLPLLIEAIKQRISWKPFHGTVVKACGYLLNVIVPQIVRQLLGSRGAVFIFFLVLSCSLKNAKGEPGSRDGFGRCRGITYGCLGDMFRDIHVDHGVAFADDPSNVLLLGISLANVSKSG